MAEVPGESVAQRSPIPFTDSFGSETLDGEVGQLIRFAAEEAARTFGVGRVVADLDGSIVHSDDLARRFIGDGDEHEAILRPVITAALGGTRVVKHVNSPVRRRALRIRGAAVRGEGGRVRGALVVVEDHGAESVTEFAQHELIANVCHELKTPIGAMALLADALANESEPTRSHELAERLGEESVRLGRVVDDLLGLGAREEVLTSTCDSHAVCLAVIERLESVIDSRRIEVRLTGEPVEILAEPVDLSSAIYHLLENALRYSKDGSSVSIDVREVGPHCEISVVDEGIGIGPDQLGPIFERFYRVDAGSSDAASTGGTGLGLAIVKQVVERNGGCVRAESGLGRGSTFTVRLDRGK